jgi:hypothetical protein
MNSVEIKSLVREVIVHYGLPFTVLSVAGAPGRWDIVVRADTGGTIPFSVADGRPAHVRETIQKMLEAHF